MGVLSRVSKVNLNPFKLNRYKKEKGLEESIIAIIPDAIKEEVTETVESVEIHKGRKGRDKKKEKENQLYNVVKELRTDQENEIELDIPKHKARKYLTKVKEFLNYKMNRPEKRVEKKVKLDSDLLVKYEFDGINWTPRTESKD